MRHSILIPHRDRNAYLDLCLWSIGRSACVCGLTAEDFEVVLVDSGSSMKPTLGGLPGQLIDLPDPPPVFCKAAVQNAAIAAARGDVLTFLDADAVVGRCFLEAHHVLDDPELVRCCYRVRYIPDEEVGLINNSGNRAAHVDSLFARYNETTNDGCEIFGLGFEAYGQHDGKHVRANQGQPWGNSQFSIRRECLGDLRFDERHVGHGMEDLDLLLQIQARYGDSYQGFIWTDADHALFHVRHPIDDRYRNKDLTGKSAAVYRKKVKELLGR